tara:strand:+ start:1213 stop:1377 length:165 start_codon:yes stop_codon:yes gene_type:complete
MRRLREEEQEVDIRGGVEQAPAVSSIGHEAENRWGRVSQSRSPKEGAEEEVNDS